MDSLRKVFAYRLKEIRGDCTQEQFAEILDLSKRTYQELEAGNIPQRKTIAKIVKQLGLKSETELFLDPDLLPPGPHTEEERKLIEAFRLINTEKGRKFVFHSITVAETLNPGSSGQASNERSSAG